MTMSNSSFRGSIENSFSESSIGSLDRRNSRRDSLKDNKKILIWCGASGENNFQDENYSEIIKSCRPSEFIKSLDKDFCVDSKEDAKYRSLAILCLLLFSQNKGKNQQHSNFEEKIIFIEGHGTDAYQRNELLESIFGEGTNRRVINAIKQISNLIAKNKKSNPDLKFEINIGGFSRGGIVALAITKKIQEILDRKNTEFSKDLLAVKGVNLFLIDPVPGNFAWSQAVDFRTKTAANKYIDLRECKILKKVGIIFCVRSQQILPYKAIYPSFHPKTVKKISYFDFTHAYPHINNVVRTDDDIHPRMLKNSKERDFEVKVDSILFKFLDIALFCFSEINMYIEEDYAEAKEKNIEDMSILFSYNGQKWELQLYDDTNDTKYNFEFILYVAGRAFMHHKKEFSRTIYTGKRASQALIFQHDPYEYYNIGVKSRTYNNHHVYIKNLKGETEFVMTDLEATLAFIEKFRNVNEFLTGQSQRDSLIHILKNAVSLATKSKAKKTEIRSCTNLRMLCYVVAIRRRRGISYSTSSMNKLVSLLNKEKLFKEYKKLILDLTTHFGKSTISKKLTEDAIRLYGAFGENAIDALYCSKSSGTSEKELHNTVKKMFEAKNHKENIARIDNMAKETKRLKEI